MPRLKEIEVSMGLSLDIKGIWYRPNVRLTVELDEEDTPEMRERVFRQAWNEATGQIEKQILELTTNSPSKKK